MSERPRPESGRPLSGPLLSFDLEEEVSRLQEEKEWQEGRRNAITLHKGEGLSVVLLVMKGGDRLEKHSAPGPITLNVRQGRISFEAEGEAVEAGDGTLISCNAGVPHTVEALQDAVCVLTVASGKGSPVAN